MLYETTSSIGLYANVTLPESSRSLPLFIGSAYKKIASKEFLDKITSIAVDTRKYANKSYNQFKKWY